MNNKEDYLSYKDCLKLKKLGYNWASDGLWYLSPTYNGEWLGSDEEYELRSEGITEFDYKPRTWLHYHKNEDCNNKNECSLVDYYNAAYWLETVKNVKPFFICCGDGIHKVSITYDSHSHSSEKECRTIKECVKEFVKLSLKHI